MHRRGAAPAVFAYLTSTLYPIEVIEALGLTSSELDALLLTATIEGLDFTGAMLEGELRTILLTYTMLDEALDITSPGFLEGELRTLLIQYSMLDEALEISSPGLLAGELRIILISYVNYIDEALDISSPGFLSGVLT